ncbi:SpoIIE family protein phosphatase [Synechococcus sp. PCC 7502]|uniref:SpoIIE family protein phosphatase n=1 Tax=Synechococcus sp. PCC 7502 TaxID=1173263 RepID=UPI0002FFAD6F|nr:SpoIIE family protein phosphatase [Synechococcus sp. PCC 7502]
MNNLKYPQKFLVISLIFSLPMVLMLYLLVTEINSRVEFARKEIIGNQYLRSLNQVWKYTLQGKVAIQDKDSNFNQSQIAESLKNLESVNQSLESKLQTTEIYRELTDVTKTLSKIDNSQNAFIYQIQINTIKKLRSQVGDTSNLILDPDLDTYYLMDTTLLRLPAIQQILTEIEFITRETSNRGFLTASEESRLNQLSALLKEQSQTLNTNLNNSFKNNPANNLSPKLGADLGKLLDNFKQISQDLDQAVAKNKTLSFTGIDIIKNSNQESFKFADKTLDQLDILLNYRINSFIHKQILISLFVVTILLVVAYLFVGFYQSVMQTVRCLDVAAKRMTNGNAGNLETISLDTKDELGTVVEAFNRIAVALVEAINSARSSEVKYRSIFENAIEGIFQTSPQGEYVSVNPSLVKMYGYDSADELISTCTNVEHQLYVDPHRRQDFVNLMAKNNQVIKFESEIYRKDRSTIWISEDARAVKNEQGELLYYEGSVRDISDRKAAEKSLQKANLSIILLNEQLKAENMRMSAELSISRRLQQMILPRDEELKQIKELDISGYMEPATEVGGDYYDILVEDGGKIKIGIGDVTGHGLESSVLMIMVQTAVRTLLVNNETDPIRFLNTLNRTIYDNAQRMESGKNLTLSLIDYECGKFTISGQHEEMIIVRATGEVERIDTIDLGFPIGLEPHIGDFINKTEVELNENDVVVLYTDGVTEAEDMEKEQYGIDRLCTVVLEHSHLSANDIRQAVIDNLRSHIGEQQVFDDITLLVIKQK